MRDDGKEEAVALRKGFWINIYLSMRAATG